MSTAHVLKLPNFNQPFVVETDACNEGIGAVLMQDRRPIAFLSKKLGIKNQALSTYEKELLALYTAVTKWRHYLLGQEFIIKTDQISLKYLLEQKVHTPMQHRGLSKLLGLNYKIEYKKGVDNRVADALSRREGQNCPNSSTAFQLLAVTKLLPQWVHDIKSSYEGDTWIQQLQAKLVSSSPQDHSSSLSEHSGILRIKNRICVGSTGPWRQQILQELHDSTVGGHSGITATYHRVKKHFYWPHLKEAVHIFVQQCHNCQLNKGEHLASPGLLQPLPIPENAWTSVGMDFITGLPKSKGFEVILVIVDRLTKYAHFIGLSHPFTAPIVAQAFMDTIYKLHGLPTSIISDRDPIFTSRFWKELMSKIGIKLNMSTAYHPQTDGQTEKVNQCLEQYLRAMVFDKHTKWATYLPLAEWWYNTTWHSAIKTTPFEALYGYPPPLLALASAPKSQVEGVNEFLNDRQMSLVQLKLNLIKAQDRMKKNEDKHRTERSFSVGDWVYLKIQPYRQLTLGGHRNQKLSPKFYGPFEILQCVGPVAYRLNLPAGTLLHPVFHVSQLKGKLGNHQILSPTLPASDPIPHIELRPHLVLGRRLIPRNNAPLVQLLVQWQNQSPDDATWEDYDQFATKYPKFIREDTNFVKEGVMRREIGELEVVREEGNSEERGTVGEEGRTGDPFEYLKLERKNFGPGRAELAPTQIIEQAVKEGN